MATAAEIKQRSGLVRDLMARYFLGQAGGPGHPDRDVSRARQELQAALAFLDQNALNVGDPTMAVLDLLGPPYGRMPGNVWLYPGAEREYFYVVTFSADKVSQKYFGPVYDVEDGK